MYKQLLVTCVCFLFVFSLGEAGAETTRPMDSMRMTVERIIQVVTDQSLQGDENTSKRRATVLQLVNQRFNFKLMSRLALGDNWSDRTEHERTLFVDLFSNLLKKTYIKRIESYSEEKVVFTKQNVKKNLAMVHSRFVKGNNEISLIYKLKKDGDEWLVFDVIIEGASVIKQYRRQFSRIISEERFEGLMIRLEEKIKTTSASSVSDTLLTSFLTTPLC